ncbi:MAG: YihY/virulence factor BrkB family protein [Actinomycetota bacterium]|nr:YihY/virulence factor BrkB family protein [Actinomycetota bacterium]
MGVRRSIGPFGVTRPGRGDPVSRVNPIERVIRVIDEWQQRTPGLRFVFAVFKKFGDDRGSSLAAMMAYYGFLALFPLLLVLTTILGFIGNQRLESGILGSTLSQFPVYGQQIGRNVAHPLRGSTVGLATGLLGLLYGSLGVAQAGQHAMAQIWNVPGVVRPGFVPRLVRSLLLFIALGTGMAVTAIVSGFVTGSGHGAGERVLAIVTEASLNVALYVIMFRLLTPRQIATRDLVRGAVGGGIGYTVLTAGGTALIQHQLRHAQAVYGQFGFVLGLIGWLSLVFTMTLYAAEANVVSTRRLWPRSIVQPPLTEADRKVLGDIAREEVRRPEQTVDVDFQAPASESH